MSTEQLLRTLDVASNPTATQQNRADALLERILLEPTPSEESSGARFRGQRRTAWRVGTLLAAGAAIAAVAIAVPGLSPQPGAVASWTPLPAVVLATDLATAEGACSSMMESTWLPGSPVERVVSERRGEVIAVSYVQQDPGTATTCFVTLPIGSTQVRDIYAGMGAAHTEAPHPTSFLKDSELQYEMGGEPLTIVTGSVGSAVTSMTVRSDDLEATATITNGRYVAWLPGGDISEIRNVTYDLTLEDGTVISDAKSTFPDNDMCDLKPDDC